LHGVDYMQKTNIESAISVAVHYAPNAGTITTIGEGVQRAVKIGVGFDNNVRVIHAVGAALRRFKYA